MPSHFDCRRGCSPSRCNSLSVAVRSKPCSMHQMMMASRRCLHHSSETPASRSRRWVSRRSQFRTDGKHDGMVAAGAALAGEDVIDDGGVQTRFAGEIGTFHIVGFAQCLKKYGQGLIAGGILIEIRLDVGAGYQTIEKFLRQQFPSHMLSLRYQHPRPVTRCLFATYTYIYTSAYMEQPAIIRFSTGVGTWRSMVQIGIRTDMTC